MVTRPSSSRSKVVTGSREVLLAVLPGADVALEPCDLLGVDRFLDQDARDAGTSPVDGDTNMSDIEEVRTYLAKENGLATVSTTQADGRVLSSVVNCGVIDHPLTCAPCVALVSAGGAARLSHVRRGSQVTIAIRRGWTWRSVTGPADLIGLDDLPDGIDAEALRLLLREVFQAAGGTHDDFDEYDRAMATEGRVAVLVAPDRILGNY